MLAWQGQRDGPMHLEHNGVQGAELTVSTKLGIASLLLLASIAIPPYADWRGPIDLACAVIPFVLALLAAHRGSRLWLAVPSVIVVLFAVVIYVGIQAT
jgi:hypothetical protein